MAGSRTEAAIRYIAVAAVATVMVAVAYPPASASTANVALDRRMALAVAWCGCVSPVVMCRLSCQGCTMWCGAEQGLNPLNRHPTSHMGSTILCSGEVG